ncbi:MAG: SDR family oxidoreductase [Coriobacteriales bacterium]|jgi:NAD(P)-dependent dehydrogenase (short-subunit alcohol dehydrogenase family)|nr:SDR family oxidoreductase [Coriobacteriales bacterium]
MAVELRLQDKTAIVTGAGNGMGYATCALFVSEGAKVIAVDFREEDLAKWSGTDGVFPVLADVTKPEDIERFIGEAKTKCGGLDILCNIAGINDLSYPLLETDDVRWDRIMDLDLKAPFRIIRRAVPLMISGGGGSIINIGSYAALRGNHGPSYTAAKAGLAGLTKSVAFRHFREGIRCNIIHPGGARTNIGEHSGGAYHEAQVDLSNLCRAMPVNGYIEPDEIARACLFLASDDAKFVNGIELPVDSGMAVC